MNVNIVFVSYPSGGFGHFVFHILTHHFKNTHKVDNNVLVFSANGDSHNTEKYLPIWFHDPDVYNVDFKSDATQVILVDNGIENDSYKKLREKFNHGTIVRLTISDRIRPVIYKTMAVKARDSDPISETLGHVKEKWQEVNDWSIRENFTMLYKNWPFNWQPIESYDIINLSIEDLIVNTQSALKNLAKQLDDEILEEHRLNQLIINWKRQNQKYFDILGIWEKLEQALDSYQLYTLPELDLHDQGYINYCIECKYDVIIPVYDYKDWFKDSDEIKEMIKCLK